MSAYTKLRGAAIELYLGDGLAALKRGVRGAGRRVLQRPREVHFFHQVDDPHSHLMVQGLGRLLRAFPELSFVPHVVPEPAADVDPDPELRVAYLRRDAALLSRHVDVELPAHELVTPPADRVRRVNAVLLAEREPQAWLEAAHALGEALWRDDGETLASLVRAWGTAPGHQVQPRLETNYRLLRKMGHYFGGVVIVEGERYEHVERLVHLQARLDPEAPPLLLARRAPEEVSTRVDPEQPIEVFFSFRSPYSYLAIELLARPPFEGVPLRLRPILPMVSRGLSLPKSKRDYIVRDAHREARRQSIPFGKICDPLGAGVEHALALFFAADAQGRGHAFARAAMRGIWSEALDLADPSVAIRLALNVGLSAGVAEAALAGETWRAQAGENAEAHRAAGHWGVPVMVHADLMVWGQDRLWILARERGIGTR